MKYLILIFLALVILFGCAETKRVGVGIDHITNPMPPDQQDPRAFSGVDPVLEDYYHRFEDKCHIKVGDVPGQLTTLKSPTVGLCTMWGNLGQVQFDDTYWHSIDDATKEWLVSHELGHCVLLLYHYPDGIMFPYMPVDAATQFTDNEDALFEQLCSKYPGEQHE